MILDTTTRKLQAVLAAAVTTNQLRVVSSWTDITSSSNTAGTTPVLSNGTTAVDIVPAPAASTQRNVYAMNVYNADTAPATVKLQLNDNGTVYTIVTVVLLPGYTLSFTDVNAWQILNPAGHVETGVTTTFSVATTINGVNDQTGTTYTLGGADAGKLVRCDNASAITVTVPPNASVPFAVNTFIFVEQKNAGVVTLAPGGGVTLNSLSGNFSTVGQFDARALIKTGTDEWLSL